MTVIEFLIMTQCFLSKDWLQITYTTYYFFVLNGLSGLAVTKGVAQLLVDDWGVAIGWAFAPIMTAFALLSGLNLYANDWQITVWQSNHPGVHKGLISPNHRAGPNSAPTLHSLNRKPAPDATPGGRWVFQMQRKALTRTRPRLPRSLPAQWTFFWAWGQGGGGGTDGGGGALWEYEKSWL